MENKKKIVKGYGRLFQSKDSKESAYQQMNAMTKRILREKQRGQ
tara:strand:- start:1519 stop:1650 length:132 start_codon:yes stop_codon:yes gene_type:complete